MDRLATTLFAAPLMLGASLLATTAALAQTAPAAVSGLEVFGRKDPATLAKPTIAGSRLELSALETPASIEVLSGDVIRQRGDLTVMEAVSRATGVTSVGTPGDGGGALSARGFSGLGSVMQLYDGMRLYVAAGTITFPFDPWTVERIEVLRGPASVMFGEGAIGGAVNVVPKRPDTKVRRSEYQLGVGSFGTVRLGLGSGGPISDTLSYRVDVSRNQSDGWVDRGSSSSLAASGALLWQATPTLSFTLTDDYGDQKPQKYFGTPLIDHVLRDETLARNYNVADAALRYRDNWTQLKAEWTPSAALTLRNDLYRLTSNRNWRNAESYFWDPSSRKIDRVDYIAIGHRQTQVGDRAELTYHHSVLGMANSLAVGGEVNRIKFTHINNSPYGGESFIDPFNPVAGSFIDLAGTLPRYHTDTDQAALFAEDRLELTPQWSLVGGLRLDRSKMTRKDLIARTQFSKTFDHTDWRLGVVYAPTPSLSFYGSYATGSDPVGSLVTLSASQKDFDLSTGRQYEAGVKQVFMGGRGEWSVAIYDISKKKILTRDPRNPALTQQVGERSSRGVEGAITLAPWAGWTVDANVALLKARFEDFTESVGGKPVSRNGATPPGIPEQTANLQVGWQVAKAWQLRAGARYVGKTYSDNANSLTLPAYTVADAAVEWAVRPNTTVTLRVSNAFDKTYPIVAYNDEQWLLGRPRAVELTLHGKF